MHTKTDIIEVDFENFVTIFYQIYKGNDKETERKFISIVSGLERRLQDLDTPNDNQIRIRNLIVIKLKYWGKILNDTMNYFNKNSGGTSLLINSIFYNFNFLIIKSTEALSNAESTIIFEDILKVTPHPDDYFIKSSDKSIAINLIFPSLLIKEFLGNYIFRKLHESHKKVTNKELNFFKMLEEVIETNNDFDKAFEKYIISDNIVTTDVTVLPVLIYIDTSDNNKITKYYDAIKGLILSLDLELFYEYEPVKGSWIRKLIIRTKKIVTSDEVIERLKKIEHGLEINTINKTQSEIDKNQAEALSAILNASANIPRLATLIGSLLIIKTTNEQNEPVVFSRTLTTNELIYLKDNPQLIQNPSNILHELAKHNSKKSSQQKLIEGL